MSAWGGLLVMLGAFATPALARQAEASPRPPACRVRTAATSPWTADAQRRRERACAALALGYASLERDPALAASAAEQARGVPELRGAQLALAGQAALGLGRVEDARDLLDEAVRADPRAVQHPRARLGRARVAVLLAEPGAGRVLEAALASAALLPPALQRALFMEASLEALTRGPEGLDDATRLADGARRVPGPPGADAPATELFALCRVLGGDRRGAQAMMAEAGRREGSGSDGSPVYLHLLRQSGLGHALAAVRSATDDPATERAHWARLAAQAGSPWAARAAALARSGGGR